MAPLTWADGVAVVARGCAVAVGGRPSALAWPAQRAATAGAGARGKFNFDFTYVNTDDTLYYYQPSINFLDSIKTTTQLPIKFEYSV
ncbi:MAG: hypothetical protein J0M20_02095, partial [Burkholderiales bacterium]|nr:hypothetical protein [Burkholderiales bacterium]